MPRQDLNYNEKFKHTGEIISQLEDACKAMLMNVNELKVMHKDCENSPLTDKLNYITGLTNIGLAGMSATIGAVTADESKGDSPTEHLAHFTAIELAGLDEIYGTTREPVSEEGN